jgi:hypothetical protein
MWKLTLVGAWCVGVCLTAVYFASQRQDVAPDPGAFPDQSEHHVVKSDLVTVPVIADGKVEGYIVAEVSLTANDEAFHHRSYPASVDVTDELTGFLQAKRYVPTSKDFDIDLLRTRLVGQMNVRFGGKVFFKTLVTRLDYLTTADLSRMRDPKRNQMRSTPIVPPEWLDVLPEKG